tara:strand:+ start:1330 stop:1731 length:402 start_codon:yes stop_codon:yes gene_type:complete
MRLLATLVLSCLLLSTVATAESEPPKKEGIPNQQNMMIVLYTASQCGAVKDISHYLKDKYGEVPFAIGNGFVTLAQTGAVVPATLVFTVNPETKTFTVNSLMQDGNTCMMMSGTNFKPAGSTSKIKAGHKVKF